MIFTMASLLICVLPVVVFGLFSPRRTAALLGLVVLVAYTYVALARGFAIEGGNQFTFGLLVVWAGYLWPLWRNRAAILRG